MIPRPDGKKTGEKTGGERLMSIDSSGSRGLGANPSDVDALFIFHLHLIKLFLPGTGVCGDDQSIADKEEGENTDMGGADVEENTSEADAEKDPDIGKANGSGTGGVDKQGISGVDELGTDGADKSGIGGKDELGIAEYTNQVQAEQMSQIKAD